MTYPTGAEDATGRTTNLTLLLRVSARGAGVMALEFACNRVKGASKRGREAGAGVDLESSTRRENALVLFHLLGKVLYNKRTLEYYGDI